jgi:hypothetical protein
MPAVALVCEGEHPSLDNRLLDAVLAQGRGLAIQIVPAGGGKNPKVIRSWLERRSPNTVAIVIRDRDYQPLAEVEQLWRDPAEKCLSWRCHEIENHLLDPWVIHATLSDYRNNVQQPWVAGLPPDETAIEAVLQSLAPRLFDDHIGRTLCHALRQQKGALGSTELNVP